MLSKTVSRRDCLGLFLAGLPALSGCGSRLVSLSDTSRQYRAADYRTVLKTWTREKSLTSIEEMDNVLGVTSTYQSADFRRAYTARYAHDYQLSKEQENDFLRRSLSTSKTVHEFFVALYAQHPRWGEIAGDDPFWVVRLVDSHGSEVQPASIDKVRKPSAMERAYYPYITTYRKVFRLSFPTKTEQSKKTIDPGSEWFGLKFSGAQGQTVLKWLIEPSA